MKIRTKKTIRKIVIGTSATLTLCLGILVLAVLCPTFMYANATQVNDQITVYHQQSFNPQLKNLVLESYENIQEAEIFDPNFTINICLNDGSAYPGFIKKIMGEAFAHGFAHNTVIVSEINIKDNYAIWNDRKLKLTEVFAHEFIHNYQYNTYGFATLDFPFWKLEGICEYEKTRSKEEVDLKKGIELFLKAEGDGLQDWDWIEYENGFGSTPIYLKSRMLVQYLMEVKQITYDEIVHDETLEESAVKSDLLEWFNKNK